MKTDITNPVPKKNIFFYNIFNKFIDSIKRFVGETEEDTFGKYFTTEYSEAYNQLNVVPKLDSDGVLTIGEDDICINFYSGSKGISIPYDDVVTIYANKSKIFVTDEDIQLFSSVDNNYLRLTIKHDEISFNFSNDEEELVITETHINTLINAAKYSYDEDTQVYTLNLFPNADQTYPDYYRIINIHEDANIKLTDEGFGMYFKLNNKTSNIILNSDSVIIRSEYQNGNIMIENTNRGYIYIEHQNTNNEPDSDKIFEFKDVTNNLTVTFTVAELIAIKNSVINP